MDIDEEIRRLECAIAGAQQALDEARRSGDAYAVYEAEMTVRYHEERLSWFLHENGME